jgi:hemoglobin/transferrin/lactoferrin receptor protein
MRRVLCLATASLVLSTGFYSSAIAEEQKSLSSVKKVTVYATRSPQSSFDVPVMTSIVETDSAGNALARDIADLLEFTPGVEVENGPRRNGQTVSIRGFDDEAVITLIDNRRQNFEAAHDGRFFVDTSLLKAVEVVKGASSSIYGGGAVGGVVAFETKDASDLLAPGDNAGILTSFNYSSASDDYAPSLSAFTRTNNWDLLANMAYRHADDIEQGGNNELAAKDHILSGLFKAGYSLNDFHTLKFQYQVMRNDGKEPNNAAGSITNSNPIVNKEIRDNQYSFKYAYENPENNWLNPKLHVYFNDTSVEEADITGSNNGRVQTREMETLGFTLDNQSKLGNTDAFKQTLSYGFEYYTDEQTSIVENGTVGGVPNAEADNYGLYLQDEISFNSGIGQFIFIPAVRYDHYESNDTVGNNQSEGEVSPKIAASYKPTENFLLFGSWSRAFRAPNLTEIYASGQHFPGNNFIANPNLKPETVTTVEVGAGVNFNKLFSSNDHLEIKGSWFDSDGDNFISQTITFTTTTNVNIANANLEGWEVDGEYQLNGFKTKLGLSHVTARNEDTRAFLDNSIPLTLVSDVSYTFNQYNSTIGWRGRFAKKNDEISSSATATDGYGVHDIYYRWQPNNIGNESLIVDLGIENITDKAYTKRFASLLEEGRSYVARLAYQW